ncbi:hypothetical protein ACWGN5_06225 [Streptomyces sp. NPDC055815]
MRYKIIHRWGDTEDTESFGGEALDTLLGELDTDDPIHRHIAICDNASGWYLSVFAEPSGWVLLENEDKDKTRHMRGRSAREITLLCADFGAGNLDAVLRDEWSPGYG